jgi:ribonuclease Z
MSLRVTFLGTGGAVPTVERGASAFHVSREGDEFLFDCGEGTQRQMMRFGTGFGPDHVFVTHLHGDHVLGLPGLVQTLGFNGRTRALAVHGPPGTRRRLRDLVHAAGHEPEFPVRISEVSPGAVALARDDYEVRAFRTDHRTTSVGYALVEDDRPGRFDRETAEEELEIPPGPAYGRLHDGEPVTLDDGRTVRPEQVVGPPRPGRRVVYTGDTRPSEGVETAAADADLLVHDATFADAEAGRARSTGHTTASEAAALAARAGAKRLALVHVSARYAGDVGVLAGEARERLDEAGSDVEAFVPDDGDTVEVSFPDD